MQIDDFEFEFLVAMSEDGDFTLYQAYMIMRMAELNSGDIDLEFIQTFYNEDINSQDLMSIEMMYHYNVVFAASLDWVEHGVWAERTAEGFKGLAISIAYGSPKDGYYTGDPIVSIREGQSIEETAGYHPNSSIALYQNGKLKQMREFDDSGMANKDIDYSHGGAGHVFPHEHIWIDGMRH